MYTICRKCGKKLSDPESMQRGYGPECWAKLTGCHPSAGKSGNSPIYNDGQIPGQMDIFDFLEAEPNNMRGGK